MKIQTLHNVFGKDKAVAEQIQKLLKEHGITAINMLSSPGAGKTSLLEASACVLRESFRIRL